MNINAKKYFKELEKIEQVFYDGIDDLEDKMREETGIEDLEFFWCDNEIVGIGNILRTVALIHRR